MTQTLQNESCLDDFFKAVLQKIDPNRVLTEHEQLKKHEANTSGIKQRITGLIQVKNLEDIKAITLLASQYGVSLYPISLGKNWGYGSKLPTDKDSVILDLSDLNTVVEYNEELSYAVIEPGLKQKDLYKYLEDQGGALQMDPSGAGPDASVLGNIIERGFGIGKYCDRFTSVAGLEVVLPSGEVIKTGFWGFENNNVSHIHRWGIGPYLDGIFTQANFGIVTKMTIWLNPKPEAVSGLYFTLDNSEKLPDLVNSLRKLLLKDVFPGAFNLVDRGRVLTVRSQYPWQELPEGKRLPFSHKLYSKFSINSVNGFAPLFGTKEQVKTQIKEIKKELKDKVDSITFVSEPKLQLLEKTGKVLNLLGKPRLSKVAKGIRGTLEVFSGNPAPVSLPSSYWRNKSKVPPKENIDPARDNCGHIWLAPTVPMTGEHFQKFYSLVDNVLKFHEFETALAFTSVTPRAFSCTVPIFFDRSSESEVKRAHDCYDVLLKKCLDNGYPPYRVGIRSMETITKENKPYWKLVKTIKDAIDPNGIISPGRYCPK